MKNDKFDDPRRRFLVQALGMGLFALTGIPGARAESTGGALSPMPANRSIYRFRGDVTVNGVQASSVTRIVAGDTVVTGADSSVIFVVGKDAFHMRENSRLVIEGEAELVAQMRLLTGKLLSVFGDRAMERLEVQTPTAVIGIRGTGLYVESEPDQTYICTCYGKTDITAVDDPQSTERIVSEHHDDPRYVTASGSTGNRIKTAPFINHTDQELKLIEALVGRETPFGIEAMEYTRPRRDY